MAGSHDKRAGGGEQGGSRRAGFYCTAGHSFPSSRTGAPEPQPRPQGGAKEVRTGRKGCKTKGFESPTDWLP